MFPPALHLGLTRATAPSPDGAETHIERNDMLTVQDKLPAFELTACVSREPGQEFKTVTDKDFSGKWKVLFFWPMDFTFVCPTEIAEFGNKTAAFAENNAVVLGASTDSHFVHLAWRESHPDLKELPFPMLADTKRELSSAMGILHPDAGVDLRATYIIDPDNVIRHVTVNDLNAGRNVDETLRTLQALQTDKLTPCGWNPGDATL